MSSGDRNGALEMGRSISPKLEARQDRSQHRVRVRVAFVRRDGRTCDRLGVRAPAKLYEQPREIRIWPASLRGQ